MTADEVVALQPRLKLLSYRYANNRCDPDDLVQAATVELLNPRRHYTNAMVVANSAMKDELRRSKRQSRPVVFTDLRESLDGMPAPEEPDGGEVWWPHLRLSPDEESTARAICDDGLTQKETARRLGRPTSTVSEWWRRVLEKARWRWVLTELEGE